MGVPPPERPTLLRLRVIAGLMMIIGLLFSVWLQSPAGADLLVRSGLQPPARPFLELYFSDPLEHPPVVEPGESVPVAFALSSHEGDFTDLAWQIRTIRPSKRQLVFSGKETVPDGDTRTIVRDVPISCGPAAKSQTRVQVRVSVLKPRRDILFWVNCRLGGL